MQISVPHGTYSPLQPSKLSFECFAPSRKQEERRGRVPQDRDPEKERQETERYQEQR